MTSMKYTEKTQKEISKSSSVYQSVKSTHRQTSLLEGISTPSSRYSYVPLTHLDKLKLANHLDQLMEAFVEQVPTKI